MEPNPESPKPESSNPEIERIDPVEARAAIDDQLHRTEQVIQSYKDKVIDAALAGLDARRRLQNAKESISGAMKKENASELRKAELLAEYANAEVEQLRSEQALEIAGGGLSFQRSESSQLRIIRDRVLAEEPLTEAQRYMLQSLINRYRAAKAAAAAAASAAADREIDF